jgi:hypothetical protein
VGEVGPVEVGKREGSHVSSVARRSGARWRESDAPISVVGAPLGCT